MAISGIGEIIKTAVKNIDYEPILDEKRIDIADSLAQYIHQNQRNWLPIYVKEIGDQNYELIGNPIILEATKRAGIKVAYCIQVDERVETRSQIIEGQQLLYKSQNNQPISVNSANNLIPLLQKIEDLEHRLASQEIMITKIFNYVLPDKKLFINNESASSLKAKLSLVPRIGAKTLTKVLSDITDARPYYSEVELLAGVRAFHRQDKKPTEIFKNLMAKYELDYSI